MVLFLQPQLSKPRMIEILAIKLYQVFQKAKKSLKKVSRTEEIVAGFLYMKTKL